MKLGRGTATWARRGLIAVVLVAAAVIPSRASSRTAPRCSGAGCESGGSVLWTKPLTGSWIADNNVAGTVPATGDAYAASAGNEAVLGYGTTVTGYDARTGEVSWQTTLSGVPPGSAILSVRAWPSTIAVGVSEPAGVSGQTRAEVILSAATGHQVRAFPTAQYGGAIWATKTTTVIVGRTAVVCYANATGRILWRRLIGRVPQSWLVSGSSVYVTDTAGGYLSSSPVTALRQIDLRTGRQRIIRPEVGHARVHAFDGAIAGMAGGVVLFSGSDGLSGYSTQTGLMLWGPKQEVLELIDHVQQVAYVGAGNDMVGISLHTGQRQGRAVPSVSPGLSVSSGLFAVRDGVALGLDEASLGEAWGYEMASRRVIWTSPALGWPHFFVDPTGLGGSVSPDSSVTLITTCAALGPAIGNGGSSKCAQPELAAIKF